MDLIRALTEDGLKKDVPEFNVGDTVKVYVKVKEGNRERAQLFEGKFFRARNFPDKLSQH